MDGLSANKSRASIFEPGRAFGHFSVLGHWPDDVLGQRNVAENTRSSNDRQLFALRDLGRANETLYGRLLSLSERTLNIGDDHIIPIYEVIVHEGQIVVATPFVAGESLAHLGRSLTHGMPRGIAIGIALELLELSRKSATSFATAIGQGELAHGNLSPQHVLISYETGRVFVGSWGLTEALSNAESDLHLPVDEAYASPDRKLGEHATIEDDMYSIGLMLWEMLTGIDRTASTSRRAPSVFGRRVKLQRPSAHAPGIDKHLDDIVMRSLAPLSKDRFSSVGDFQEALTRYMSRRLARFDVNEELHHLVRQRCSHKHAALSSLIERWKKDAQRRRRAIDRAFAQRARADRRTRIPRSASGIDVIELRSSDAVPTIDIRLGDGTDDLQTQASQRSNSSSSSSSIATSAHMPLREAAFVDAAALSQGQAPGGAALFDGRTEDLAAIKTGDFSRPRAPEKPGRLFLVALLLLLSVASATLYVHLAMPEGTATMEGWAKLLQLWLHR
ncbi:MAG: protein kinase [Deltaproteobacteria bacterium]|nr:protein kinase [Deltaproteobacteria bacterium]